MITIDGGTFTLANNRKIATDDQFNVAQTVFLKDALDALGVEVQLIRHGKYKSAGEMFIRNDFSKENLEQNQAMINSLWNDMCEEIAGMEKKVQQIFRELEDVVRERTDFTMVHKGICYKKIP